MKLNPWPVGICVFFLVVFGVNAMLVTVAAGGYGGMLDKHPYAAGLEYDTRKAQLEAFKSSGWHAVLRTDRLTLTLSDDRGAPIADAVVLLRAIRPNAPEQDREMRLEKREPGVYRSAEGLGVGRWLVDLEMERAGRRYRIDVSIVAAPNIEIEF